MEVVEDFSFASFINWLNVNVSDSIEKSLELKSEPQSHDWSVAYIDPMPSESLLSWLIRQSNQFNSDYTLKDFLKYEREYWKIHENIDIFEDKSNKIFRSLGLLDILPLRIFNMSLGKRGLQNILSNLQFQFPSWITQIYDKYSKDKFLIREELVYCPGCWRDPKNRYFKIEWRFSLIVVCSEHATLLQNSCPNCDKYLFSGSKNQVLTNMSYKWLETCVHCGYNYNNKSIVNRKQIDTDCQLLDLQYEIVNNVMKNEFSELIQDLRLLFGIKWENNDILVKYLELVLRWTDKGRKIRQISKNLITFDIWKFELIQKYNLGNLKTKLRIDKILDLDTLEIKCFIDSCKTKYYVNDLNGKIHLILHIRTHTGLKRAKRDIYNCRRCNIGFPNQYKYQLHYYKKHAETVNCNKCNERFPSQSKYQVHVFSKHKKVWNCGKCELSFHSISEYHTHYEKEHQKIWNCRKCRIKFPSRSGYHTHYNKKHLIITRENGSQ